MAPARRAQAEGPRQADGLPRDHPRGDRPRRREPDRAQPRQGGRLPDQARPRPALRLRGLARAVEEGHAAAVRGPRPVGRHPPDRRQGAGADRVPLGELLGPRGRVRHGKPRQPNGCRTAPTQFTATLQTVDGKRVAQGRDFTPHGELRGSAAKQRPAPGRRGRGRAGRPAAANCPLRGVERRAQAVPPLAVRAVPHHHAAAGGEPQARLLRQVHDVRGAAAVRERLHHLHADRLDHAVADRDRRRPQPGPRAVRRRVRARRAAHLREQGEERPGGARGDPPGRRPVPHPAAKRSAPGCEPTSCGCTT